MMGDAKIHQPVVQQSRNAYLQSVKDKQHYGKKQPDVRRLCRGEEETTQVRDYMGKAAKQVVTYCIGTISGL